MGFNRTVHLKAIHSVLDYINSINDSPYVLKGGTALSLCYGLNRFSEDIDLDCPARTNHKRLAKLVDELCRKYGYSYRAAKDTPTTQRFYIDYGDSGHPLKVEVSYRRKEIDPKRFTCVDGYKVYTLDELARLKAAAYSGRDKIRDLYDVTFLCTHYLDELSESARDALSSALEYKDLNQFDYIVQTQKDDLIDPDVLEDMFLQSFSALGLLDPSPDDVCDDIEVIDDLSVIESQLRAITAGQPSNGYHDDDSGPGSGALS